MAENSKIEWTHHTFNPWIGCAKVSAACDHCYAEHMMDTRLGRVRWGHGEPRTRTTADYWRQPVRWNARCGAAGTRERVFCASLADVFDSEVVDSWRDDLFELIAATPHLDWLLLTKRPVVARRYLRRCARSRKGLPRNIWLGTSVEDQAAAKARVPILLDTPAPVRFLSCEPLLGVIDLRAAGALGVDWVIAGGESGPRARPTHPAWFRSLRDQCVAAGIAFHFKQHGDWVGGLAAASSGLRRMTFDDGEQAWRVGKKSAGRLLDGRAWDGLPAPRMQSYENMSA